jgi:hypothetical protein
MLLDQAADAVDLGLDAGFGVLRLRCHSGCFCGA